MDFGQRGVILTLREVRSLIRKPYKHSSMKEDGDDFIKTKLLQIAATNKMKSQKVSYVPIYLQPHNLISTPKMDVLPGVTLKKIPVDLAKEIKQINQILPIKPTFIPNYVISINQIPYLDAFFAKLENEGKDVEEMLGNTPAKGRRERFVRPRDIAKQILISILIIRDINFRIGTHYEFNIETRGTHTRYQISGGIPNPGEERSVLMEHAWLQRISKRIQIKDLRRLNEVLEVYFRPNYWYRDRIAVALNNLWTALCSSYLDQAFLSLMMVFEALLSTRGFEITHMLSERTAILFGNNPKQKVEVYRTMKHLYNTRSNIAHGKGIQQKRGKITWDSFYTDAKRARAIVPVSDLKTGLDYALSLIRAIVLNDDLRVIFQENAKNNSTLNKKLDAYYLEMLMQ